MMGVVVGMAAAVVDLVVAVGMEQDVGMMMVA
jgi:hypothetical protein